MLHSRAYDSSDVLPPYKKFSPETRDFVKTLMKETGLTTTQKKEFAYILRSGEPTRLDSHEMMKRRFQMKRLNLSRSLGYIASQENFQTKQQLLQQRFMRMSLSTHKPGRRRLEQIKASGAYDPEIPLPPNGTRKACISKEKEIERLQHIMEFGTDKPSSGELLHKKKEQLDKQETKDQSPELEKVNRFNEITDEIAERIEFLNEMQALGKDKDYRGTIEFQISEKLREVQANYCRKDFEQVVEQFGLEYFLPRKELKTSA